MKTPDGWHVTIKGGFLRARKARVGEVVVNLHILPLQEALHHLAARTEVAQRQAARKKNTQYKRNPK